MCPRRIIINIFLFSLLLICSCFSKPRIEFNEIIHDFGQAKHNTELKYIFVFKNTGSSTLIIENVKSG
jgi:hypothetical protein